MDESRLRAQTERFLRIAQFGHTARGLAWIAPMLALCDCDALLSLVAEWWHEDKALTVWFDEEDIYYIKSQSAHLTDGYVARPQDLSRLMVWLLCEPEAAE